MMAIKLGFAKLTLVGSTRSVCGTTGPPATRTCGLIEATSKRRFWPAKVRDERMPTTIRSFLFIVRPSVFVKRLDVIDHDDGYRHFLRLQLESELFFDGIGE